VTATDRPVLVGIDGSPEATEAARAGAREAARLGARLDLVLVLRTDQLPTPRRPDDVDLAAVVRSLSRLLVDAAAHEARQVAPGIDVEQRVVDGHPVELLAAGSRAAALLCIGARGSGRLGDLVLGSTAAALVRAAECPVLVFPAQPAAAVHGRRGVVVGLDGGPDEAPLLEFAFAAAAARGTELVAVHTWQHTVPGPAHLLLSPLVDEAAAQRREEAELAQLVDETSERHPDVPVRRVVERGRPAATLVPVALTAELLVVGRRHRRGRLGSVAGAVLHAAPCPIGVVPLGAGTTRAEPARDVRAAAPA
jgi:nucleotide-binding universal stress UspA family protein